jgi:hypothetical protein
MLRKSVCIAVVALGLGLGFVALGKLGASETDWNTLSLSYAALLLLLAGCALALQIGSVIAVTDPERASRVFLWASPPAIVLFYLAMNNGTWSEALLWSCAMAILLFVTPALFWKWAHLRHWPTIASPNTRLNVLSRGLLSAGWIMATISLSVFFAMHSHDTGDCEPSGRLISQSREYRHVALTARIIHSDPWFGTIGIVQEHFFGLPWWNSRIVFSKYFVSADSVGEIFLYDGFREYGWIPRLVAVINLYGCGRTGPVRRYPADLKSLREPTPAGVRILGRVTKYVHPENVGVQGIPVRIWADDRPFDVITDSDGIFDRQGLPDGLYRVEIPALGQACKPYDNEKPLLKSGDTWGCEMFAGLTHR